MSMETSEWKLTIIAVDNGYLLEGADGQRIVLEEDDVDDLKHQEHLLWEIMEYFNFLGSKHDQERLRVVRERRSDNESPEDVPGSPGPDQEVRDLG